MIFLFIFFYWNFISSKTIFKYCKINFKMCCLKIYVFLFFVPNQRAQKIYSWFCSAMRCSKILTSIWRQQGKIQNSRWKILKMFNCFVIKKKLWTMKMNLKSFNKICLFFCGLNCFLRFWNSICFLPFLQSNISEMKRIL